MPTPVYLDYHATTPVDRRVLDRMLPFFTSEFGNAASASHPFGWRAAEAVATARKQVAALVGVKPSDVIFTSGATEAINLALLGLAAHGGEGRRRLVTQVTEHAAVLDTMDALERKGFEVVRLGVDEVGRIRLDELERAVDGHTLAVSIMLANNEIGTIQPVEEIGRICRAAGALFHSDLTQAAGWGALDLPAIGIDLAALSGHKIYGPKGVGALIARTQGRLDPVLFGGGHESGLRPGTLNVPSIVGLGAACELARAEGAAAAAAMRELRDRFYRRLTERIDGVTLNGCPEHRHPGNLNIRIQGVDAGELTSALPDVAFSGGSACSSGSAAASHVITALGPDRALGGAIVRFGLGRSTTADDVDRVADQIAAAVTKLRGASL